MAACHKSIPSLTAAIGFSNRELQRQREVAATEVSRAWVTPTKSGHDTDPAPRSRHRLCSVHAIAQRCAATTENMSEGAPDVPPLEVAAAGSGYNPTPIYVEPIKTCHNDTICLSQDRRDLRSLPQFLRTAPDRLRYRDARVEVAMTRGPERQPSRAVLYPAIFPLEFIRLFNPRSTSFGPSTVTS